MATVPIVIAGETGGHRSVRFNSELTQNCYLDVNPQGRAGIHDFPGLAPWYEGVGADRGWHVMAGVLYKLNEKELYSITDGGGGGGIATALGNIATSSDRASMADDGTNLLIVTGARLYIWDGSTITEVPTADYPIERPKSIVYLNRQFIMSGDDGKFCVSDVGSTVWNALNFAFAEIAPDPIVALWVHNQLLYVLGSGTCEIWYNTGAGNPPMARRDTSLVNVGCASPDGVTQSDQYVYWLGDDRRLYQTVSASGRAVNSSAISHVLDALDTVSDCIASRVLIEGQDLIVLTFPLSDTTVCYSETLNYWFTLSSDDGRWFGNSIINIFGKNLAADWRTGSVHEMRLDTYDDVGVARKRIRTMPSWTGELIGMPGRQVTVGRVRVNMEVGVGLATSQGVDPVLMFELSPDGGKSWDGPWSVSMGVAGDYLGQVDCYEFSTGHDVRCRLSCSDPVFLSMYDGFVEIVDAGY